jgi:hypothetical protein
MMTNTTAIVVSSHKLVGYVHFKGYLMNMNKIAEKRKSSGKSPIAISKY